MWILVFNSNFITSMDDFCNGNASYYILFPIHYILQQAEGMKGLNKLLILLNMRCLSVNVFIGKDEH